MGRGGNKSNDWWMVLGAVTIVCMFFAGYRSGVSSTSKAAVAQSAPLRREEKRWVKDTEDCNKEQATFATKDTVVQKKIRSTEDTLARYDKENGGLFQETERLDGRGADCLSELQAQVDKWEARDAAFKERITAVTEVNRAMLRSVKRLSETRGMSMTLLYQSLYRVRSENYRLRAVLGQELPEDPQAEEDKLLEDWAERVNMAGSDILPVTKTENSTVARNLDNRYTWDPSHSDVFMPKLENKTMTRPTHFGREGTEEVVKGVVMGPDRKRVNSVPFLIRSLYNYGLCAFRNKNGNFTYPDNFYTRRDGNKTHASDLIDTPLVRFCTDCRRTANSTEFKLACLGDTVDVHYGSRDFWAVRSMIRFHTRFYTHVDIFLRAAKILSAPADKDTLPAPTDYNYMAAVYRGDKQRNRRCMHGNFLRHYKWTKRNFPEHKLYLGEGQTSPICSPTISQWFEKVKIALETTGQKTLYISTFAGAEQKIKKLAWPEGVKVVVRVPRAKEPENQVMDIIVLSKAKYFLADAYSDLAQVATEAWHLEHQFKPEGFFLI